MRLNAPTYDARPGSSTAVTLVKDLIVVTDAESNEVDARSRPRGGLANLSDSKHLVRHLNSNRKRI